VDKNNPLAEQGKPSFFSISRYLAGKAMLGSVLVTGGTGSFAVAFVRRLLKHNLSPRICVYSRSEFVQSQMREIFKHDERLRFMIGDVRDVGRLERAMSGVNLVVHAAALKRIEVGRDNPIEMVRTNVDGSVNVVEAAQRAGVDRIVGLSSDKAFEPISPYGQSKALMEAILFSSNDPLGLHGPRIAVTRYGNVWNSRGSVVPVWRDQLRRHGKVRVTDPECTRFFMLMSQAVDLVLETAREMKGGEIAIPELPAYRLGDLAEAMGCDVEEVGLGKHEKRHEFMCAGRGSEDAPRMSVDELRSHLHAVGFDETQEGGREKWDATAPARAAG
jgi:UDP-N-acetylglucosamine 4,6-dehydratase